MPGRCLLVCVVVPFVVAAARADEYFEAKVRPLLVEHCLSCHGEAKQKGGLRLDTKAGWQAGGENGPAVVPGKPAESLLLKAVRAENGVKQMPPKGKLADRDIVVLTKWVTDGAVDPRVGPTKLGGMNLEDAKSWWAFQPVNKFKVQNSKFKNEIDALVFEKGAKPPPPTADKRTLIRRATYDLTGLAPTSDEVDTFVKDNSPEAFAKVVDRLLASPHYGERWGRHWLDLVRYADTAGENSDHPLPHAWRYRNWVIDAFNRDQPYDEFVREQIAGDILAADGPPEKYAPRVIATGFLAVARRFDHDSDQFMHLTHEDGIDTVGKAFLGLTLGCARCHDHKYDAISAKDYYALYGIFASTKFAFPGCEAKQQPRDMVPLVHPKEWERTVKPHVEKLAAVEKQVREVGAAHLKHADAVQAAFAKSRKVLSTGEIADGGDKTFAAEVEVQEGEVLLLSITPLKGHGADTTLVEWDIAAVGGKRWNATADLLDDFLAGNPHADGHGNKNVWWMVDARNRPLPLPEPIANHSGKVGLNVWRNGDTPSVFVNAAKEPAAVWTKLPARSLFAHPAPNGNVALGWLSPVAGKVKITGRLADAHPGGSDGVGWVLEQFAADIRDPLQSLAASGSKLAALERQRTELSKSAPKQDVAYAVVEGTPADAKLHLRGDPEKLGEVVPRRWLEVLGGTPIQTTGSGRLDLANWIASKENPLTARVMVNRIWLHHFGTGLVPTPNDFGTRGVAPTNPHLLDWLAAEFVTTGWSVKAVHRTIMLTAAYQSASFDRRRLSAEEIRDSLLTAGGNRDRDPAKAHPFPPEAAWNYTQHVPFGTFFETNKRSVYLVSVRNRRHPFLGLFDGADPNSTTPQRQATTVPTQALFFLNDPFFHTQAEKLAGRVLAKPDADRVGELFGVAFQRSPSAKELSFANEFLAKYREKVSAADREKAAWAALCRVLLASNEFLYVD